MNNKQAYEKLTEERPVIIKLMERDKHRYRYADGLADAITARDDPAELAQLIKQSAAYMHRRRKAKAK